MATKKFDKLKVGETFYANGGNGYEQYRKTSALEYESIANSVLGSFYATPGFEVEVADPKPAAKPAAKKKSTKKSK